MTERKNKREAPLGNYYGRRHDRPLKDEEEKLLTELLPTLQVTEENLDVWLNNDSGKHTVCEIGFGGGEHLYAHACANPDKHYLGIEPFISGTVKLLQNIAMHNPGNMVLCQTDAKLMLTKMPAGCLDEVYILFADPWPKKRHHKRRIINHFTLNELYRVLKPGGEIRIATDHPGFLMWVEEHLVWAEERRLFTVQYKASERPHTWPPTRYEQKALSKGDTCHYFLLQRL